MKTIRKYQGKTLYVKQEGTRFINAQTDEIIRDYASEIGTDSEKAANLFRIDYNNISIIFI